MLLNFGFKSKKSGTDKLAKWYKILGGCQYFYIYHLAKFDSDWPATAQLNAL